MLLHDLIFRSVDAHADRPALRHSGSDLAYGSLAAAVRSAAGGLAGTGLVRHDRVAVYLPKQPETVVACFAASCAGGMFVPVNPLLKAPQVGHVLRDCAARVLLTSPARVAALGTELARCPDLHTLVLVGDGPCEAPAGVRCLRWPELAGADKRAPSGPRAAAIDADPAAILYTSGSTGRPKGVVLSHRNLVSGARSVATYLDNRADDRLLAVLPLSFDYGFSQLTTAFSRGACVVLLEYLLPRDVLRAVEREAITGLAAVPPLWIRLARLDWPGVARRTLRYLTSSGGTLPRTVVESLRAALPDTRLFLMYGLTEAFRSTCLPPEEIDRRPGSIGRAIPNAEVCVVRPDGSPCAPGEPGELVHRGALVALGYWNDPPATAARFRPAPGRPAGLPLPEIAVWSGDRVRADEDGFLYFIGRDDDMIKTSGYRVSPTEVEEVVYASGLVGETCAVGVDHPELGEAIVVVATPARHGEAPDGELLQACREGLPGYMVPQHIQWRDAPLPRTANGKLARRELAAALAGLFDAPPDAD